MNLKVLNYSLAALCLLCSACTTLNVVSLDMLTPSELSFPPSIRTVGVVDNVAFSDTLRSAGLTLGTLEGDGKVMAEQLAERLSSSEYFNDVVLCDSSLRRGTYCQGTMRLSTQQVNELSSDLGADLLVVVDGLGVTTRVSTHLLEEMPEEVSLLEGAVASTLSLYVPGRKEPLQTGLCVQDTLHWVLLDEMSERELVEQVASRAAELSMKYLVPQWHSVQRFYYAGGSVEMRDAAVAVRENNWAEAGQLWQSVYDASGKNSSKRMQAALNLALYHEVQGEIPQALEYGGEALSLAKEGTTDRQLIRRYQEDVLSEKVLQMQKLTLQMGRFNEK